MLLLALVLCVTLLSVPAEAGCSPSNAVVAVVSVVSTLVVIALILLAIYLILRRRRNKETYLKTHKTGSPHGDFTDGYVNAGFEKPDPSLAEEGLVTVDGKGVKQGKKKNAGGKDVNTKTWSSFPQREQPGILYRPGSCGSLDENMQSNSEIITVCLESQDIIGLGFNISGNFGEGIQVSQVHNRGPAVECGKIKVGDKILSVEVSYENIVYEDALTILSYASPYPVKITLQKGDARRSRDSALFKKEISPAKGDEKLTSSQLNHPLYRSQSLDVFKQLGKSKDTTTAPFQPKRTQSEMKPETRKDGGKSRKKGDRNSKSFVSDVLDKITGTISPSKSRPHEVIVSDVVVHQGIQGMSSDQDTSIQMETFPPTRNGAGDKTDNNSDDFTPTNSMELASLMDDKFDLKHDGFENVSLNSPPDGSPVLPPSKPERRNKKQDSFESQESSSESLKTDSKGESSVNSDVEEEIIVPSAKKSERRFGNDDNDIQLEPLDFQLPVSGKYDDMEEALSPLSNVQIISVNIDRSPSPDENVIVEDLIEASDAKRDSSAITLSTLERRDKQEIAQDKGTTTEIGINTENVEEPSSEKEEKPEEKAEPAPPALDEAMLERLIAMNSYDPGTQGWAGIQAGGNEGGIDDDFVPAHSKEFMSQPVHKKNLNESSISSRPMSPPSLSYELRDDVVRGVPVAVGIKSKPGTRDSSPAISTTTSTSTSTSGRHNKNVISNVKDSSSNHSGSSNSSSSGSSSVVNKSYNTTSSSKNNNKSNNNNNENNKNRIGLSQDIFDTTARDVTSYRLVNSGNNQEIGLKSDWSESKSKSVDNDMVNSHDGCMDDLTDSDSECAMTENPSRLNFQGSEPINSRRSKLAENSDISNSFTSSSGEASPPYSTNGQELGSSPEFSLSKSPLELMSAEADSKSNTAITVTLHRQDSHSDVEC